MTDKHPWSIVGRSMTTWGYGMRHKRQNALGWSIVAWSPALAASIATSTNELAVPTNIITTASAAAAAISVILAIRCAADGIRAGLTTTDTTTRQGTTTILDTVGRLRAEIGHHQRDLVTTTEQATARAVWPIAHEQGFRAGCRQYTGRHTHPNGLPAQHLTLVQPADTETA